MDKKKDKHLQQNKDSLISAIELGEKQTDDLDIDRNSDDATAPHLREDEGSSGESSGEELDGVFHEEHDGHDRDQTRILETMHETGRRHRAVDEDVLGAMAPAPGGPRAFGTPTFIVEEVESKDREAFLGKRLVRERRLELLQQRRAKRELRSRKQIDRQVKAQARKTETNTDRSALLFSGWGVDHGYTGVAFSAPNNSTKEKSRASGGGGSGGGRSGSLQASNANAAPTMYHRAMGALLGVVATELMKRVDALEGNTTTSNKHEMQHLLKILVHEAPKVFEEGAQLVDFVPNWGRLLRAANGEGGEGGEGGVASVF